MIRGGFRQMEDWSQRERKLEKVRGTRPRSRLVLRNQTCPSKADAQQGVIAGAMMVQPRTLVGCFAIPDLGTARTSGASAPADAVRIDLGVGSRRRCRHHCHCRLPWFGFRHWSYEVPSCFGTSEDPPTCSSAPDHDEARDQSSKYRRGQIAGIRACWFPLPVR